MTVADPDNTNALLRQSNELLTLLAKIAVTETLRRELASRKLQHLYRLTGQGLAVKQLSAKVGMAVGPISEAWQRWESLGLLIKDGKHYRRVLR